MNQVQLFWNITQDLELKQTPSWKSVLSFSIATNNKIKDQQYTEFHNCVVWGKAAELIEKYLWKWSPILIKNWELRTRSWEAKDWTKRYRTEVIIRDFQFVGWGKKNDNEFTESDTKHWIDMQQEEEIDIADIPF